MATARQLIGPVEEPTFQRSTERVFKVQGVAGDLTRRTPASP